MSSTCLKDEKKIEQLVDEIASCLAPVRIEIDKNSSCLISLIPVNVKSISIINIKKRLMVLIEDISISSLIETKKKKLIEVINIAIKRLDLINTKINESFSLETVCQNSCDESEDVIFTGDKERWFNIDTINEIIDEQISNFMKYRIISSERESDLTYKIRLNIFKSFESELKNNKKINEEDMNKIIFLIKEELGGTFEIKEELGSEYINSKNQSLQKIVTIQEVVDGEYRELENSFINKYATILELSNVDEDNLNIVRDFVVKMGPEFIPIFDELWIQGDFKRKNKISEIKIRKKIDNDKK